MENSASQLPRVYYCRHMQPGTARYENETILVDTDGMKALLNSLNGKSIPVYVQHQDVDLKTMKEKAAGYVTEAFYNALDGWAWFKFVAVDDDAHVAIKRGWSVSNAYMPTSFGPAGTKNNVPYQREVRNGHFTHLAIVPDPRYEGARIYTPDEFKNYQDEQRAKLAELKNSKEKKSMFKLFKNHKEEVTSIDLDTEIEIAEGKSVSVREMINALTQAEKEKEQVIEVNGKKIPLTELVNSYTALENGKKKMKKNAEKTEAAGEEEKEVETEESGKDKKNKKEKKNGDMEEEEDCRNSDKDEAEEDEDEEAKKNRKKEKKNSSDEVRIIDVEKDDKFFQELRNASTKALQNDQGKLVTFSGDALARGKARYGSDVKKSA